MPPGLSRLQTPVRRPSIKDCDPERLVAPSSVILDDIAISSSSSSSSSGRFSSDEEDEPGPAPAPAPAETRISSTISNNHLNTRSSGSRWEVSVKDGAVQVSLKDNEASLQDPVEDDHVPDVSESAHLCEAVLRSVLAISFPVTSLEERLADADFVIRSFDIEDQSVLQTIMLRAQKAAQYRRSELQLQCESLQKDDSPRFEDPEADASWKGQELQELTTMISKLEALPPFSGFVQVGLFSVDNLQPVEPGCGFGSTRHASQLRVYASVTILPARSSTKSSPPEEPGPAFVTESVASTGRAEWQALSPWIPVTSAQDKVLIQVWDVEPPSKVLPKKPKLRKWLYRKATKRQIKVAPWNNDVFIGQVIFSFGDIEADALKRGVMRGKAPVITCRLADEKGKQKMSVIELQCGCSLERIHRTTPSNNLFLKPPVADVERGFDALVPIALKSSNDGKTQLSSKWERILSAFGSHYRIRKQRCSLGIVSTLARLFQQDMSYLSFLVNEWLPVCQAAKEGELTKNEVALHNSIASTVIKPAIDAIENFQTVFPGNRPADAVSHLITLLSLALRWDPDPENILIPLTSWIKNSFQRRFYSHLFGDAAGASELPSSISLSRLTEAVKLVRRDISELETAYGDSFPRSVCILDIAVPTYYKLVSGYVMNAIRADKAKIFTKECEDLVVELMNLHQDLEDAGQLCELLNLREIFDDYITQLVAAARARMIDWVSASVNAEKWNPLSPRTGALFSFSVVDLYFMLGEVMDELMTRLSMIPFGESYFQSVEDASCTAVKAYVEILETLCLRELMEEPPKETWGFTTRTKELRLNSSISLALCVKINDMNAVLEQHQDLERKLKGSRHLENENISENPELGLFNVMKKHGSMKRGLSASFQELQQFTVHAINTVIGSIVDHIQTRTKRELESIFEAKDVAFDENVVLLTTFLDEHLKVMNENLHPAIFQNIITEICKALVFCMEEFALNRDENPTPMTQNQRQMLEEALSFFDEYFYGDGVGIDSEKMNTLTARLRRILSCWDLDTRELCSLYWKAWDQLNSQEEGDQNPGGDTGDLLHLLDYLCLLKQRTDDEAREIVARQNFIANKKMMQFMFGLPKEEEVVASFSCRNSEKVYGTMYITGKHICFADTKMSLTDNRGVLVLPLDRLLRVEVSGKTSILLLPLRQRPLKFSAFSDRDSVCQTIFNQVAGTGSALEKSMAPIWSSNGVQSPTSAIKVFKCWRQSILHKYSGTLLVSAAYILFTQDDKQKILQMDHASISRIHAGRRGLRPSGVVVELKSGEEFEFCEFQNLNMSNKEIAKELHKLVFPAGQ